jgi:hypothetical protein
LHCYQSLKQGLFCPLVTFYSHVEFTHDRLAKSRISNLFEIFRNTALLRISYRYVKKTFFLFDSFNW